MAKYANEILQAINNVVQNKKDYETATDDVARKKAATDAQQYYNQLISYGRNDVADTLKNSNYNEAIKYQNALNKTGKTEFRPYMYSLGKGAGLSNSEVDALISFDNDTKEISFAGKKIGQPDTIVDGSSYFSDTSVLDNAFNDYRQRTGNYDAYKQIGKDELYISEGRRKNYDFNYSNPFETDWGKEMMSGVKSEMDTSGNNALASGASTNSGNLDSFAAANATRQKEAVLNSRKQSVLANQQRILENAESILSNIGIDNYRRAEIEENRLNGITDRLVKQSNVTGYVPAEWANTSNPFFGSDGKLINENLDYQAIIDKAKENGDTTLANYARAARGAKMFSSLTNYEKWGKYANEGEYTLASPQQTEKARQFDAELRSAENIANNKNATDIYTTNANIQAEKDIASGKALEEYQSEAMKTAKQAVSNSLKNFNSGLSDTMVDVVLFTSDGTPYFNPNLSSADKIKYYNSLKTYLQNDPSIDDVLKQGLLDELNPNSSNSSKIYMNDD